jgi:serine/threonine protein kinase
MIAGQMFGPYRVLDKLGEGGMGEVWRATDTTLQREVAIKFLPAEVAGDPERLARFAREARLLAALNHPNIAQVYGFGRATFPDGSAAHVLAMELVPGEDLAGRLARGPWLERLCSTVGTSLRAETAVDGSSDGASADVRLRHAGGVNGVQA